MKRTMSIVMLLLCHFFCQAQSSITGKIIDRESGMPLSGATIQLADRSTITTDRNGMFLFDCSKNSRLTISFIGYETKQQAVGNCTEAMLISLEPSVQNLGEVEVTATSGPNRKLLYQPASITKLNSAALRRGTGLFLDDAINTNVPGVTMSRRSMGGGQQLNIRGYGNGARGTNGISSNFDIQGTKVYLNGIPVTDAEGITVLDDIDFGSIGNVEVLKGPSGSLYGLAIAGVVNMRTAKPEKGKTAIGQEVLAGSYGLRRYTTHFSTATENAALLVNYGYQEGDGFVAHTASQKRFINVIGDFTLSPKQTLATYFGYSNSYDERQGELTIGQYDTLNWSGNPAYIARNAHSHVRSFRAGASHTYRFSERFFNTTTIFGSGVTNDASSAAGWTDKTPINFGLRTLFQTNFVFGKDISLSGITGVETQHQYAQTIGYNMATNPADPAGYWIIDTMRSNIATYTANTSVFTEWTLALPQDISFTAGVGVSNMHLQLEDRYRPRGSVRPNGMYAKNYNGLFSPHVALNKVFSRQLSLYASYSRGQRAPVTAYFFIPATNALNTSLKPEKGDQVEIGSKGSLLQDKFSYQLAFFRTAFSDKMTAVAVPLNPPGAGTAYSYVANGGKQLHKGIEAAMQYTAFASATAFISAIRPFANATFSDFEYRGFGFQRLQHGSGNTKADTLDYSGNAVAGISRWVANIGVDVLSRSGLYANAVYNYRDKQAITSDNLLYAKGYNLLNAKIGFKSSFRQFDVDAYFGASNLTGTKYYYMIFINQLPDAYLPAPKEAHFFGGLSLKYNL